MTASIRHRKRACFQGPGGFRGWTLFPAGRQRRALRVATADTAGRAWTCPVRIEVDCVADTSWVKQAWWAMEASGLDCRPVTGAGYTWMLGPSTVSG